MKARFIGVPRSVVDREIGEMYGWRHLGDRMLARAKDLCPVSEGDGANTGPHLRDVLELRVITGSDPRLMIGTSTAGKADVLAYLTAGTQEHFVAPVTAKVLHWSKGGVDYFSAGHMVKGIEPNDFVLRAARSVAQEAV